LFGVFCAAAQALDPSAPVSATAAPVIVGVTVFAMVMGAHQPFSTIPPVSATPTFAAILGSWRWCWHLMVVGITGNPVLRGAISMVVGALFGIASAKLAGALTKKA
jgi:hypothetical protein